jgi:CHRD domain-containing protein
MKLRYLVVGVLVGALCAIGVGAALGKSGHKRSSGVLFAYATGKKEVSATTGKKGAGDSDARAGFTAVIDGGQFCWGIAAKNVDGTPSGAHIHRGGPKVNGPIVIPLDAPTSADPGASSGCETVAADLLTEIKQHPRRFYFNIHSTPDFPAGAARGQLSGKRK